MIQQLTRKLLILYDYLGRRGKPIFRRPHAGVSPGAAGLVDSRLRGNDGFFRVSLRNEYFQSAQCVALDPHETLSDSPRSSLRNYQGKARTAGRR